MATMKAVQVPKPGAGFEIVEREIPRAGRWASEGPRSSLWNLSQRCSRYRGPCFPGISYPRVPWTRSGRYNRRGRRRCRGLEEGRARRCRLAWRPGRNLPGLQERGFRATARMLKVCGISYDGGYQEFMVAPVEALAHMPESLDAAEAAPLMCAGVTTFNALRHSGAVPSDLVAIQGIGGLGHLAIQFAKKFRLSSRGNKPWAGYRRRARERAWCRYLIDSAASDASAELQKIGGAQAILATAPSGKSMSALIGGLGSEWHPACRGDFDGPHRGRRPFN